MTTKCSSDFLNIDLLQFRRNPFFPGLRCGIKLVFHSCSSNLRYVNLS
jgi:hypothetical protein